MHQNTKYINYLVVALFFLLNCHQCFGQGTNEANNKGNSYSLIYTPTKVSDAINKIVSVYFQAMDVIAHDISDPNDESDTSHSLNLPNFNILQTDFENPSEKNLVIDAPIPSNVTNPNIPDYIGEKVNFDDYKNYLSGISDPRRESNANDRFKWTAMQMMPMDSFIYSVDLSYQNCNVWFKKIYTLNDSGYDSTITVTCKLTLKRTSSNPIVFKIVSIDTASQMPEDKDHDGIADDSDDDKKTRLNPDGGNKITLRGVEDTKMERRHPRSRFGLSISGGALWIPNNEFTQKDISGSTATIKASYFSKLGVIGDVSGIYTFSEWMGVRLGFMLTNNNLDGDGMASAVNGFLQDNGITSKMEFYKESRKLYIPHVDLRFGNFSNKFNCFSIDFIAGEAIPNNKSKQLSYTITQNDSLATSSQNGTLQINSLPFLVYGGRINWEWIPRNRDFGRFFINVSYLRGNYSFSSTESLSVNGAKLIFDGGTLSSLGVLVGVYFNLATPKITKSQDAYEKEVHDER